MTPTESLFLSQPIANQRIPSVDTRQAPEAVRRAAEEFESFFLSQMFEMMFEGVETDGPFGGGHGEKVFRSLMISEYGKSTASRGGVGIADQIIQQLLMTQEVSP